MSSVNELSQVYSLRTRIPVITSFITLTRWSVICTTARLNNKQNNKYRGILQDIKDGKMFMIKIMTEEVIYIAQGSNDIDGPMVLHKGNSEIRPSFTYNEM